MNPSPRAILVFARAPVPGRTKTRLIPAIGEKAAAMLHRRMLLRTLAFASQVDDCQVQLWCAPDTGHRAFQRLARRYRCRLLKQEGGNLGERMARALQRSLAACRSAVVIGTDCPELASEDLEYAFEALEAGDDAVIGPAADGGYYLLGLRRFEPALFLDIDWGSDRVLAQTLERIGQSGMRCGRLALRHDLDRPEDLDRFPGLYPG